MPGKNRQEGRQRNNLCDGALEHADHEGSSERRNQVHLQPGMSHAKGRKHRCVDLFFLCHTVLGTGLGAEFRCDAFVELPTPHLAHYVLLLVHHRVHAVVSVEHFTDCILHQRAFLERKRLSHHNGSQRLRGFGQNQVPHADHTHQAVIIRHKNVADLRNIGAFHHEGQRLRHGVAVR